MAGTLLLLKQAGCEVHTINLANGCVGSTETGARGDRGRSAGRRRRTRRVSSARFTTSAWWTTWRSSTRQELVKRVTALVRQVKPDMVFTQSMEDYMDDHMNTAKLAVTATFSRNIPFFRSIPDAPAVFEDAMLYHATPHILTDMMRRPIVPEIFVDITAVIDRKETAPGLPRQPEEMAGQDAGNRFVPEVDAGAHRRRSGACRAGSALPRAGGGIPTSGSPGEDCNPLADLLKERCLTVPSR